MGTFCNDLLSKCAQMFVCVQILVNLTLEEQINLYRQLGDILNTSQHKLQSWCLTLPAHPCAIKSIKAFIVGMFRLQAEFVSWDFELEATWTQSPLKRESLYITWHISLPKSQWWTYYTEQRILMGCCSKAIYVNIWVVVYQLLCNFRTYFWWCWLTIKLPQRKIMLRKFLILFLSPFCPLFLFCLFSYLHLVFAHFFVFLFLFWFPWIFSFRLFLS